MQKIIFIVGPTAVGKSEVALILAKRLNAEIISCDSMQVYKELNIITSKPQVHILKRIPHHLINVISVKQEYNVADFRKKALRVIKAIQKKNKIPLVVGGSGLYMSALLDGVFKGARKNSNLRNLLKQEADIFGSAYLHNKLKEVDPLAASKIHPHDLKKIIRGIEVFRLTQKPISHLQINRNGIWQKFDIKIFGLLREREELYQRINQRVEEMFRRGLIKEIKNVLNNSLSITASACLGIKEIKAFLEGVYDLEEAKRLLQRNSRHYAKRQLTWFNHDKRINWIKIRNSEKPRHAAQRIYNILKKERNFF